MWLIGEDEAVGEDDSDTAVDKKEKKGKTTKKKTKTEEGDDTQPTQEEPEKEAKEGVWYHLIAQYTTATWISVVRCKAGQYNCNPHSAQQVWDSCLF